MDEFAAILRARQLIAEAVIKSAPVDIARYLTLSTVNGVLQVDDDLQDDQAGSTTMISGRNCIFVNGRQSPQRQRFTVLHEIGHIVLKLPSSHSGGLKTKDLFSYQNKPAEEIVCDVFAAELLLPEPLFRKDVNECEIGFEAIETLASSSKYDASLTSTGSRFAVLNEAPCAFVLAESGIVRYVSYSVAMRNLNCWIPTRLGVPEGTLTAAALKESNRQGPVEVEAYRWFEHEKSGRYLVEDVRVLEQWNQSLTLLWFEKAPDWQGIGDEVKEDGLGELDGNLPWPSKRRRR